MNEQKHRRPQDDLPYEQRMKAIIQGYRWLLDQNERLAAYARKLERDVQRLREKTSLQGYTNRHQSDKLLEKSRECKRLKAHIAWLEEQLDNKSQQAAD